MMEAAKINDWLQVIGMFGVIASLVFVGLQMKQTQEIALSNTYQARAHASVERNVAITTSPILLSAEAKLWVGKEAQLTPEEIVALSHNFYSQMDTFENNHYQLESGFLSEEHWQKNLAELKCIFTSPFYQQMWVPEEYRASYSRLIDRIVRDARDNPSACWDYEEGSIWDWG
jgi:hypothetical protein